MNRREIFKSILLVSLTFKAAAPLIATSARAAYNEDEAFPIAFGDVRKVPRKYRRREVDFPTEELPGSIIVDTSSKFLYFILGNGRAMRYGIGVGRQGFEWSGEAIIRRKAKWPRWTPPKDMVERDPLAAKWKDGMPGGPENPLGARALYLFQGDVDTLYRLHGTFQPETIGKSVSSGCIRLVNPDIVDLYNRVSIGAKVIVLQNLPRPVAEKPARRRSFLFARDR